MHMCAATFSLLSLLPLPPDDHPASEALGDVHKVGEVSDEHVVGEVGDEHIVADVGKHILSEVGDVHVVDDVVAGASQGEAGEQVLGSLVRASVHCRQGFHCRQGVHCKQGVHCRQGVHL